MAWRPLNAGWGTSFESRRIALFRLAGPVFRQHGYRGATIKALAHACHLSPAALYHYFPSKAAMATCLLDRAPLDWDAWQLDPAVDPLIQLGQLLEIAIAEMPDYLLAIELAREMGRPMGTPELGRIFGEGEALFGRILHTAAPGLTAEGARELARRVLASLIGPYATGLGPDTRSVKARTIDLLRLHLIPVGVDPDRFERAMSAG